MRFMSLWIHECRQTLKSLIFYFYVAFVAIFFLTNMGSVNIRKEPVPGQESYGTKQSDDPSKVMSCTLGLLEEAYYHDNFQTRPVGFTKHVQLSNEEKAEINQILEDMTGMDETQRQNNYEKQVQENTIQLDNGAYTQVGVTELEPASGVSYEQFVENMERVDSILGGGSSYAEKRLSSNASVDMTYEDALEQYQNLVEKDRFTGGYARLFCDYMGIVLGIAPIFMAVTRGLRDRRSQMQDVVYIRSVSSAALILSRYLAMVFMMVLPVILLSFLPLTQCLLYTSGAGISADVLAFLKYSLWMLVPEILVVSAVGMMLTEFTQTALAIAVQVFWWFLSLFSGVSDIYGGNYGWNLIPRNNSVLNYQKYAEDLNQLVTNRIFYTFLALAFVILTVLIYERKRKGGLDIRGKIHANRKIQSKI